MNGLLTGAAGFLGSHLLWSNLCRSTDTHWLCMVRAASDRAAHQRVQKALQRAAWDCGHTNMDEFIQKCMSHRVTVCAADLTMPNEMQRAVQMVRDWATKHGQFEVIHAAAALSFNPADHDLVFAANLGGTQQLWQLLSNIPAFFCFNLVSTAYVAGQRDGDIAETLSEEPPVFNNAYEESKWRCEQWLVQTANTQRKAWRILRPSIIVGHSRTHRSSSDSGLYKMCEAVRAYKAAVPEEVTGLDIPVRTGAVMDMIAVDIVCAELWDVLGAGLATHRQVFHLTQIAPLRLADLFAMVAPASGLAMRCLPEHETPPRNSPSGRFMRIIKPYLPYCSSTQRFLRTNILAIGAGHHQASRDLGLEKVRTMVECFYRDAEAQTQATGNHAPSGTA